MDCFLGTKDTDERLREAVIYGKKVSNKSFIGFVCWDSLGPLKIEEALVLIEENCLVLFTGKMRRKLALIPMTVDLGAYNH